MRHFRTATVAPMVLTLALTGLAHAQATRTWVSGVGDDANPCSRTAPCKTFAGAISKTAAGGEISVLDPGGYGAVTITKAMTLNGDGTLAGILNSGFNGVIVAAGATDTVILRNLSLNGASSGTNGIRFLSGKLLVVDRCTISGNTGNGIDVFLSTDGNLVVKDTVITGGTSGVKLAANGTVTAKLRANLDHVSIQGAVNGVDNSYLNASVEVINSVVAHSTGVGAFAQAGNVSIDGTMLMGNATAAQAQTGATVRISNSDPYDNSTGFGCGGGTLASAGNNRKGGNSGGGVACAPNAVLTQQ